MFRFLPAHGTDADGIPEAESPEEIRAEIAAEPEPAVPNGVSPNGTEETPELVPKR